MDALVEAALKVRENAWAPFSKFKVGAAIEDGEGRIHTGCNVENATYGLTICAERVAVGNAVSEGCRKFCALAVVAPSADLSPCGACRQVLAEFGECVIVCADSRNTRQVQSYLLSELLPHAFKL